MFLKKLTERLCVNQLQNNNFLRNYSAEPNIFDKWKVRFAEENISEIDSSIRNILGHVLGTRKPVRFVVNIIINYRRINK